MRTNDLLKLAQDRRSLLCVGLDPDPERLPMGLPPTASGVVAFCWAIIQATRDLAIAYKVNTAYFEALGADGWRALQEVAQALPTETLNIADAKRGDIAHTSQRYAEAFFGKLPFNGITVSPYMGPDGVEPFLTRSGTWAFLLASTSNPDAATFQHKGGSDDPLYLDVVRHFANTEANPKTPAHVGFVAGATKPKDLAKIRKEAPKNWLLVPGVGAQGGSLNDVMAHGLLGKNEGGLLINSSRGILYASNGRDFQQAARSEAQLMVAAMANAFD